MFFGSVNLDNKEIDQNIWLKELFGKVKIFAWVKIPAIIQNTQLVHSSAAAMPGVAVPRVKATKSSPLALVSPEWALAFIQHHSEVGQQVKLAEN